MKRNNRNLEVLVGDPRTKEVLTRIEAGQAIAALSMARVRCSEGERQVMILMRRLERLAAEKGQAAGAVLDAVTVVVAVEKGGAAPNVATGGVSAEEGVQEAAAPSAMREDQSLPHSASSRSC